MKFKNHILVGIITIILLLFIFYMGTSFICLDLDFRQWSSDARIGFVFAGGLISIAGGFSAMIFYDMSNNNEL